VSTTQAARGKVLAEFAESIDEGKGSRVRAPQDPNVGARAQLNDPMHPDASCRNWGHCFFPGRIHNVGYASSDGQL
jgi:hypothetical protein